VLLFLAQAHGTAKVASLFGPVMVVWFLAIGALGILHISDEPHVFFALSPLYAFEFLLHHGLTGFMVLGAVFLTVTGAEALYADMGHFGRWPIQAAWLFFVLPCLALNYLGQGAYALKAFEIAAAHGHALASQDYFFLMIPPQMRVFMLVLAAAATVIASQAVITGAYSLTQQAIQLGLLPRMTITRTSEAHSGQIYLPQINSMLLVGVLVLVALFQSSDNLSHAYGLAVTGTMVVTTCLSFVVVRYLWRWKLWQAVLFVTPFITLDTTFLAANALKIISGGWVPLLIGGSLFTLMATWVRGVQILTDKARRDSVSLTELTEILRVRAPHRVPGAAIFLTSEPDTAPVALMHNLKHNKVLHEKNVILTVRTTETPRVDDDQRLKIEPINEDFKKVTVSYGFMESPNLPKALALCRKQGLKFDIMATSFFLGRRSVVPSAHSGMPLWQDKLFIYLMKNAANPTEFFKIPPGRVVELGAQVTV
jgi:KUP system potassium uptake protein